MNEEILISDDLETYVTLDEEIKERELYKTEQKIWYTFPLTFWDLVDKLNWKENCNTDLNIMRDKFKTLCENNRYVMNYFNKFRNSLRQTLQDSLQEYELKIYGNRCSPEFFKGGDDSWDDFANHIIGLGYYTYFDVLNHPEHAKKYMEEYVESFAYCFHYE